MLIAAFSLALLIGLSLGLLGGGGSILTLPVLVYVVGLPTRSAIATSLIVVGLTSATALVSHARAGRVDVRVGVTFGAAGMLGAYLGGRIGSALPTTVLLVAFAAVMLVTAAAMMRGRVEPRAPRPPAALAHVLGVGALVGSMSGLLGAGGGFLIVPALSMLTGLPMARAIGTSLLVIAMQSAAGVLGNLGHAAIEPTVAIVVTGAAVLGSLAGAKLVGRLSPTSLRRGFAWFVLAFGLVLLVKQLPLAFAS